MRKIKFFTRQFVPYGPKLPDFEKGMLIRMKHMKHMVKLHKMSILLFGVSVVFHFIWPLLDGVSLYPDSDGYIFMEAYREPVYPIFLAIHRLLFGDLFYLKAVIITQALLRAYATWKVATVVGKYSKSKYIMPITTLFFQFVIVILCRFLAVRQTTYLASIETEGIGISLYLLFVIQLFLYLNEGKHRYLTGVMVYCIILCNLRKQMLITFLIVGAVCFLVALMKRITGKELGKIGIYLLIAFIIALMVPRTYNYVLRGEAQVYSGTASTFLVHALYASTSADEVLFEDENVRQLYVEIMSEIEEQNLNYEVVAKEGNWRLTWDHYANSYDAISYGVVNSIIQSYVSTYVEGDYLARIDAYDEIDSNMMKILMLENYRTVAKVCAINMLVGFCNTIAKHNVYLDWYSLLAYVVYGGLGAYCLMKKNHENETIFFLIVSLGIVINAIVVGATIFTQTRYMIYNFSLFYTSLLWMIYGIWQKGKKEKFKWIK